MVARGGVIVAREGPIVARGVSRLSRTPIGRRINEQQRTLVCRLWYIKPLQDPTGVRNGVARLCGPPRLLIRKKLAIISRRLVRWFLPNLPPER